MNRNQVKGSLKDATGKVQRKFGEMTRSTSQQVKGAQKQVEGKLQKGLGNLEEAADEADREEKQHRG